MADPTPHVRQGVYNRDGRQCVSCGSRDELTFQHRQAVGMGGSKLLPIAEEGVTACMACNTGFEGAIQTVALLHGWKAPRWVNAHEVPVLYPHAAGGHPKGWYRLEDDQREPITEAQALTAMRGVYGGDDGPPAILVTRTTGDVEAARAFALEDLSTDPTDPLEWLLDDETVTARERAERWLPKFEPTVEYGRILPGDPYRDDYAWFWRGWHAEGRERAHGETIAVVFRLPEERSDVVG